jgi:hypothetical protein
VQPGAQPPVEADRRAVPVQHGPLHPPAASLRGHPGHRAQQRQADAATPLGGEHEQVLEIERGARQERGVREVIEREPHGLAILPGDQRLEVSPATEAVAAQARHTGLDLRQEPFVTSQAANQGQDRGYVAGSGPTDVQAGGRQRPHSAATASARST